ncbi:PTS sugar transporter subunit IIA [Enterococcus saccharolyticus]|uniref:PTS sugar transporter subunit IIA n=1 Tax=Enterococcus saccharolyticus TaxID=41997 RepID=UPI001E532D63|nr:PTS sugar transporter subunit IIA [Enterococcus saccharolyticus]MCD5002117.1 PTS sugar transporter subunit IIA [Enterococcus saccharolyticus]
MIKKEFLFETSFTTKEELFKAATEFLVQKGYVTNEFEEALNTRENEFPTGLPTVPPVAIPHTDGTFVKNDTILCIVNKNEVAFNEMGGDEEDIVLPKVFFMLVLGEGATHLAQLQNLIEKIQAGELVEKSLAAKSLEEFENVVNTHL